MRPYYEQDGITIYHADCRDVLPGIGSDSIDVVVTDPPYGVKWESNWRRESFGKIVGDDGALDVVSILREAIRCLSGGRHIYAFGRQDFALLPLGGVCELVWDKVTQGAGDTSLVWAPSHEPICFGFKQNKAQRRRGSGNGPARLRRASVLRYQRPSGASVVSHPTEKPVGLLRELIESSSRIGELVLDPHRRDRVWIVAYPNGHDGRSFLSQGNGESQEGLDLQRGHNVVGLRADVADTGSQGPQERFVFTGVPGQTRCNDDGQDVTLDGWWNVEPNVGRVAHGIPARVDRLRGLGNAIVPQVAEWLGRRLMECQ